MGDIEQPLHLVIGAGDPQLAAELLDFSEQAHDDAQTRAVHEFNLCKVEHQLAYAFLEERVHQPFHLAEAVAQREAPRAGDRGDVGLKLEDFGFQYHAESPREESAV